MELIISGRSEGLAAASAINDFFIREGTAMYVLQTHLKLLQMPSLPFHALGIYIEALDHTKPSSSPITVQPQKKLVGSRSGQSQKMYELTIGNGYYQLDAPARRAAICSAFVSIAESLDAEFPSADGRALADRIRSVAQTNAAVVA
ncbi:hypothetical protein [Dokdonella sp.]|uniref:hypothetical protein n=1 Tax=Dokdonella sp. TaxID=2291710 RepID=UPI003784988F